jgi:hypothetical protein
MAFLVSWIVIAPLPVLSTHPEGFGGSLAILFQLNFRPQLQPPNLPSDIQLQPQPPTTTTFRP